LERGKPKKVVGRRMKRGRGRASGEGIPPRGKAIALVLDYRASRKRKRLQETEGKVASRLRAVSREERKCTESSTRESRLNSWAGEKVCGKTKRWSGFSHEKKKIHEERVDERHRE